MKPLLPKVLPFKLLSLNTYFLVATAGLYNHICTGGEGDYFYIIERGSFSVTVNSKVVGKLSDGKSFGELALVYNTPRQATVQADQSGTLFSLDRNTFKFTLANNLEGHVGEVESSLKQVPLLQNLTQDQLDKLADAVAVVHYNAGTIIDHFENSPWLII